jgi:hypothetical protein
MRTGQSQTLLRPGTKKALAATVAVVAIATGLRFAWHQLLDTGLGAAVGGLRSATEEVFGSEDILRSGRMITGALIRERYLPADGRSYTHRVSYTDRDSLARWTQSGTFDAIVQTTVDTRDIPADAVEPKWVTPSEIVYTIRLPAPQVRRPFWVSEPRDLTVDCNFFEAGWRFLTVNPAACADGGANADPLLRTKAEQDFAAIALADRELFETGQRDVENRIEGIATPFVEPLADKYGFDFGFDFVWYTPDA